jgi:hypothetical protein
MALSVATPRLRGRIHQVAFFVSIPMGVTLVALASGAAATAVSVIYAVSLTASSARALLTTGTVGTPRASDEAFHHWMIYVLTAERTPIRRAASTGPGRSCCCPWRGPARPSASR